MDRVLPSSAVQVRCWSRPTTTRMPRVKDSAACSAWSRHTTTVKNDGSCSRRPLLPERPPSGRSTPGTRGQAGVHGGFTPRTGFQTGFCPPVTSAARMGVAAAPPPWRLVRRAADRGPAPLLWQATAASRTPVCGVQGGVVACRVRASRTHQAGTSTGQLSSFDDVPLLRRGL
jgi:hypothetical protein